MGSKTGVRHALGEGWWVAAAPGGSSCSGWTDLILLEHLALHQRLHRVDATGVDLLDEPDLK